MLVQNFVAVQKSARNRRFSLWPGTKLGRLGNLGKLGHLRLFLDFLDIRLLYLALGPGTKLGNLGKLGKLGQKFFQENYQKLVEKTYKKVGKK